MPGIGVVADAGVALMLFTIGLQLDPRSLLKMRALGTAAGQALANTAVTALALAAMSLAPLGRSAEG